MTVADDLATLRSTLIEDGWLEHPDSPLAALDRVEAEIARLTDGSTCPCEIAESETIRELARRVEAAEAEVARLRDGLRDARRDIDNMGRWSAHPNDPTPRDWALVITECEQSVARINALLAEDGAV